METGRPIRDFVEGWPVLPFVGRGLSQRNPLPAFLAAPMIQVPLQNVPVGLASRRPGLPHRMSIRWDAPAILTGGIYVPETKPTTLREAVKAFLQLPLQARTLASIVSAEPVNGTQFLVGIEIQALIDQLDNE